MEDEEPEEQQPPPPVEAQSEEAPPPKEETPSVQGSVQEYSRGESEYKKGMKSGKKKGKGKAETAEGQEDVAEATDEWEKADEWADHPDDWADDNVPDSASLETLAHDQDQDQDKVAEPDDDVHSVQQVVESIMRSIVPDSKHSVLSREEQSRIEIPEGEFSSLSRVPSLRGKREKKSLTKTGGPRLAVQSLARLKKQAMTDARMRPRYMNSYHMEARLPFHSEAVKQLLASIFVNRLAGMTYNASVCAQRCKMLASEVRSRVKGMLFDRTRFICMIHIFQNMNQGMHVAVRFLWDGERDSYAYHIFENRQIVCVGAVYAIYYE